MASLSESHTNVTALHTCVCIYWQYASQLTSEQWNESDDRVTRQAVSDSQTANCRLASGTLLA